MIRKILITIILALIMLIPVRVFAAGDIEVTNSGTKIDFPNLLTFNISAQSSSPISRIRLLYEVDKVTYAPAFAEAWPTIQPGTKVSATWSWDMRKGSLPPGAKITYWWIIQDDSGNKFTSIKKTVIFDDTRYTWKKVTNKMITINWYKGDDAFANKLLDAAVEARDRLEQDAGVILDKPVNIYIYSSYLDLRGSIVAAEEWTGGVAYAGFNIISIGIAPNNLDWGKSAVAHEIGHLITHQVTSSPYGANIPPWLDEGLAMHAEGPQSDTDQKALRQALDNGTLATLKTLSSPFSADPKEASYAYAESQSVVEYIANNFEKSKINNLLTTLNDGMGMDDALTKVYGFNLDGLYQAWEEWLKSQVESKATSMREVPAPIEQAWFNRYIPEMAT